ALAATAVRPEARQTPSKWLPRRRRRAPAAWRTPPLPVPSCAQRRIPPPPWPRRPPRGTSCPARPASVVAYLLDARRGPTVPAARRTLFATPSLPNTCPGRVFTLDSRHLRTPSSTPRGRPGQSRFLQPGP